MLFRYDINLDTLIDEMLDRIPPKVWKSSTTTFLDPAAGGGQFIKRIVVRLRKYGHSDANIRRRVVGVFGTEMARNYAGRMGVTGTLVCDILEVEDMDFDVTCGNPPYQDANNKAKNRKLWHTITENSIARLKPGGYLAFVTPSTIVGNTGFSKKMLQRCCDDVHMQSIDYTVGSRFFPNIGVDICAWILQKAPAKPTTQVTFADGEKTSVSLFDGDPKTNSQKIQERILEKIAAAPVPRIPLKMGDAVTHEDGGQYTYYHSGKEKTRTSNRRPSMTKCKKLVVPFSTTYTKYFVTTGYVGMFNAWCPLNDEVEYNNYVRSLNTPLVKFFILKWKRTAGYTPAVKYGQVPIVPDVSTDELYEYFKLTKDEIAYVEQYVK